MPHFSRYIHSDLPERLFLTRDGRPRTNLPSVTSLSPAEITTIEQFRNMILRHYFPRGHRRPYAAAEYGLAELGSGLEPEILTVTAGRQYASPGWVDGGRGGKVPGVIHKTAPFLMVPGEDRETYPRAWARSMEMWVRHLTGGAAIFPCWKSVESVSVILLDVDMRDQCLHDHLGEATAPWADAFARVGERAGVQIRPLFRVSGRKGFWIEIHIEAPIDKTLAAEFVMAVATAMANMGFRMGASPELLDVVGEGWGEDFWHPERADYTVDVGNCTSKCCRLPGAAHQATGRLSEFIDPSTGGELDWRPLSRQGNEVELCVHSASEVGAAVSANRPLIAALRHPDDPWSIGLACYDWVMSLRRDLPEPTSPESADAAAGRKPRPILKWEDVQSGWNDDAKQWVLPIGQILEGQPLDRLQIPDIHDGETNYQLVYGGVLSRVYSYLNASRGDYDANDVWELLRPYIKGRGKEPMVKYLIQRDMKRGLHRRSAGHIPAYVSRVRAVCEAAGIDVESETGQRTYHVLAFLTSKHWHGDDTYTAVEIAKSLGLPVDADRIGSSRQIIGREIKKLIKLHLLEQTQIGNPKLGIPCSRCRLLFEIRDPAPDVWPDVEVDDLTTEFEAAVQDE